MAQLYLIRHGQTDWNAQRRFQGSQDIPLNETGRLQAKEAANNLASTPFEAIYSSQLIRAKETAEIIRGSRSQEIQIEEDLREGTFGSLEGECYGANSPWDDLSHLSYEERLHHKWVNDQETAHQLIERVVPCLLKIASTHEDHKVLVVTHGGVMRTLLAVLEKKDWSSIKIHNTEVLIFEKCPKAHLRLHATQFSPSQ